MKNDEHKIQRACVKWFNLKFNGFKGLLFAVPNGGSRHKLEAVKLKLEGVVAGTADLIFLKSNRFYGALCVEMKTEIGRQSDKQKEWQRVAESNGNKYVICRSLDEFIFIVENYIKDIE
ncbi:MAG: VRR-NUC domain-containing protein [Phocaeicola sp.]